MVNGNLDRQRTTKVRFYPNDAKAMIVTTSNTTIEGQLGEMRGEISGLKDRMDDVNLRIDDVNRRIDDSNRRIDDVHRLQMVIITVAGAGMLSGIVGVILQLVK